MIALLLALHPRAWRARYGQEFRALLEAEPVTATVVLDVLRNAARQHVRVHATASQVVAALAISLVVEVVAVHGRVTDNILWPPSTRTDPGRCAAALATRRGRPDGGSSPPVVRCVETLGVVSLRSRLRGVARRVGRGLLLVVALYLVGRAVVEVATVNPARPETYRLSWGGPHYLGVLLVHAGPGVLVLILAAAHLRRRTRPTQPQQPAADSCAEVASQGR